MSYFLDWLCTINEVCAMYFNVKFLKKTLSKNGIIFAVFPYWAHIFLPKNFFVIEIKKCAYTKLNKFCLIENCPEWKTALN